MQRMTCTACVRLMVWLLPLALLPGCVAAPAAPAVPVTGRSVPAPGGAAAALTALRSVIGDAACSSDAQCRTVAVGAKSCGGPEAYLAWSLQRSDPVQLQRAAEVYNQAQAAEALKDGRVSNCQFVDDPGAVCLRGAGGATDTGRCQVRPRSRLSEPTTSR
jgi:hypothetical protein